MICVYAICHVKPECTAEFIETANILIKETRKEEGNISYCLGREIGEENVYTFIEQWQNDAALDLHISLPHFTEAVNKFQLLLKSPLDVHKLKVI